MQDGNKAGLQKQPKLLPHNKFEANLERRELRRLPGIRSMAELEQCLFQSQQGTSCAAVQHQRLIIETCLARYGPAQLRPLLKGLGWKPFRILSPLPLRLPMQGVISCKQIIDFSQ